MRTTKDLTQLILYHPFSQLASMVEGVTEYKLGEVLCCPPIGLFRDEVFLEAFCPGVAFARWNRGGGLTAAVIAAAAVNAFVLCSAAIF